MGLNGGGYTFLDPQDLLSLTNDDVQAMFTDNSSFLLRVRCNDSMQQYGVLKQLPQYKCETFPCIFNNRCFRYVSPFSGVATGGSGGSMNRGPELLGAPVQENNTIGILLKKNLQSTNAASQISSSEEIFASRYVSGQAV